MLNMFKFKWYQLGLKSVFKQAIKLIEINLQNITSLQTSTDEW